ncbi:MAG: hypothetical protein JW723_15455 [Bacteroidales bacterium]|nr:hypothetical protein [Bacteroidales bacterium]
MLNSIKVKFYNRILFLFLFFVSVTGLSAQVTDYAGLAEKARSEFVNGRYHEALALYSELKALFLQNPQYQYYIGRCLLLLDQYTDETIDNLKFAAIKGDIDDAWFYLGKTYHLRGEYTEAVHAYKRFRSSAKKQDIRRLKFKELLNMAENKAVLSSGTVGLTDRKENTAVQNTGITDVRDKINGKTPAESTASGKTETEEKNINHKEKKFDENNSGMTDAVSTEKEVHKNPQEQNDTDLIKALDLQLIADSLNRAAKMKRADLKETEAAAERDELITEISHLEKDSRKIQKEADELFLSMQRANFHESSGDTIKGPDEDITLKTYDKADIITPDAIIELKEEINGIKVYQYKAGIIADEDHVISQRTEISLEEEKAEAKTGPAENKFLIHDHCIYNEDNPIPPRYHYADRLVYHIQLGVFSKKAGNDSFGTIAPLYYEEIKDRGVIKYYVGLFFTYKTAAEAHAIIRSRGYQDSFLVSFNKGVQIPVDKARQIEYAQIKF